ncbi:unnamed protein product [Umbelopsis vinacea]
MSKKAFLPYSLAIITPFTKKGAFDADAVPKLVEYYKQLAPGLLVCGSTGEQHCLSIEERKQLYHIVRKTVGPDYTLYAGVAAFKTADAVQLAQSAHEAGYNGIMLGFPPYRMISQRDAEAYIREVAAATPVPIFLYNNPPRTGFSLDPDVFVRLANSVPTILGIKEAGNVENVNKVKPLVPDNISFLTGNDTTLVDNFTNQGYNGITAIIAGIYPKEMKEAAELAESGKTNEASKILEIVLPGFELMKVAGFLPSLKYILRKRGVPAGYCAPPMLDPTEEHQAALDKAFNLTS